MAKKRSTETPPYVPKKALLDVLEAISGHKKGDVITKEELHKRGISSHLIQPAISALRFLGLLDESGILLGGHEAFGRENPDKKMQKQIIQNSYRSFFDEVDLPLNSEEELKDKFQEVYGISEKLMGSCFPLFLYLAEESGLTVLKVDNSEKNEGEGEQKNISEKENREEKLSSQFTSEEKQVIEEETIGKHKHTGVQVVVTIQVNKYTTEKDIMKMVRTAKKAIHLIRKSGDSFS